MGDSPLWEETDLKSFCTRFTTLFCLIALYAAADNLNLKPGLWEVTYVGETSGAPPIPAAQKAEMEKHMAQMPPDQRAKMEAAVKSAQANLAKPVVKKSCVTKEDINKDLNLVGGAGDGNCTRTVLKATSTAQEIRIECMNGTRKSGGTMKIAAPNPESWTGTMDGSASDTGGAMQMKTKMSGKWLSSDCGAVKPAVRK